MNNSRFILSRLWQSIILVFIVTVITFFLINMAPGGPASIMRMDTTQEARDALTVRLGLDKPVPVRYALWLGSAITGDLGESLATGQPVIQRIGERLPYTIELAILTLIVSVLLGGVLGILSAIRRGTWFDHGVNLFTVLGLSVPVFWLGIMLILLFSVELGWLPSSGTGKANATFFQHIRYVIMPVFVLSTTTLPTLVRFTRSSMLEVLSQSFVRTARASGLKESVVVYWHALRNALIPVISIIGVLIPRLLSGAVITEAVFGWPGMGRLVLEAAQGRDYPLVMGVTVVTTGIVVVSNFLVDIAYSWVDPRIRNR